MLRATSTNISLITNFGCQQNCWYCIWKTHKLQNVNDPIDWKKLIKFLKDNQNLGKFSVSGGGDCLFFYKKNKPFWEKIIEIAEELEMDIDIHTREKLYNDYFFIKNINKVVFSSDNILEDIAYLKYLSALTKLRICHLVTERTTSDMIIDFLKFQQAYQCEFTIKQITGFDDKGRFLEIRKGFPGIYYLEEGDYNVYYMPDNSIKIKFCF